MLPAELVRQLMRDYGSPLYVYDADAVESRHDELRAILPEHARLLYSLKANPLPGLCSLLASLGCAAEVSSLGELAVAREAGFELGRALYTGPAKSRSEVIAALDAGVRQFSCESMEQLSVVSELAPRGARALIRINSERAVIGGLSMTGGAREFGIWLAELVRQSDSLNRETVVGIHVYQGTQLADADALRDSFESALSRTRAVVDALAIRARVLDLGGGFPWPFAAHGAAPDLQPLKPCLAALAREVAGSELWFESGRYLSASAGTLFSTIEDLATLPDGRTQVTLDTGIHHVAGMSGLRRIPHATMDFIVAATEDSLCIPTLVDVYGPLCTPLDWLARGASLSRRPAIGDVLQIPNVGAYGLTASPTGFLSRTPPCEIVVRGGRVLASYRLKSGHERLS